MVSLLLNVESREMEDTAGGFNKYAESYQASSGSVKKFYGRASIMLILSNFVVGSADFASSLSAAW